jgi:Spy/CpxP family protein refolding chaperone
MARITVAGLALAMTLGVAAVSQAQQPTQQTRQQHRAGQQWQGRGERGGMGYLLKDITLTEQQKAQLKELRAKDGKKGDNKEFAEKRDEMKEARQKGDTVALRKIREDVRDEMKERREHQIKEIREILTPDQRTIFDRNVADAQQRMQHRGSKRAS